MEALLDLFVERNAKLALIEAQIHDGRAEKTHLLSSINDNLSRAAANLKRLVESKG
jgi:16S rRNA G527 N7-methylase RsmG